MMPTEQDRADAETEDPLTVSLPRWILGPVIDWLLYSRALRRTIAELRRKGDFRQAGLKRLHRHLLICLGFLLIPPSVFLATQVLWGVFLALGVALIGFFDLRREAFRWMIPYSIGPVVEADLYRVGYDPVFIGAHGWMIWYRYTDPGGKTHKGKAMWIRRPLMNPLRPKAGDSFPAFLRPDDARVSVLFIPRYFRESCLSQSRFDAVTESRVVRELYGSVHQKP